MNVALVAVLAAGGLTVAPARQAAASPWPATPPAPICGDTSLLSGPSSAPAGAVTVPAGDNSALLSSTLKQANTTFWFAPGVHTLGDEEFAQIAPGENATFVGAPGAIIDGGLGMAGRTQPNRYAFTGKSTGVTIRYLTIQHFNAPRDEGVVNHDSGAGWTMEYLTAQNNKGGAVFAGSNGVIRYSCLKDNGQYGFQVYSSDAGGPHNVTLDHNEISGNNTDDWESQVNGCGCTGGGKFWDAHTVDITNNYVHDNLSVGLWADTNDSDFLVDGNWIANNEGQGLFYEISYNMTVRNNTFTGNAVQNGPSNSFPSAAIYLSESGGDSRVAGRTATIDIHDNNFDNNWAGVVLWENADRFCSSPANTSTGFCTIVSPQATLATCTDPAAGGQVNVEPYTSDCRWKTQNVSVHNNTFRSEPANISGCINSSSCGYQGVFANFGSSPSWSPYLGDVVQQHITYRQNNVFKDNTYLGDWRFMAEQQGSSYNFSLWQAGPFNQDAGSTYNGQTHVPVTNAIDPDTATLEQSQGKWTSWFNATPTRTTAEAHTGTASLRVDETDQFWGINLTTAIGYPITPIEKRMSFWARGSGTVTLEVQWPDGTTTNLTSPPLTSTWQEVSAVFTPPAGARTADIAVRSNTGTNGGIVYLDDFVLADIF